MSAYLFKKVNRTDILFHYNAVMISVIKQVEGVRFDNNQKRWTLSTSNLPKLIEKFQECDIPYVIDVNTDSPPRSNIPVTFFCKHSTTQRFKRHYKHSSARLK